MTLRALLVSMRDRDDPMVEHETECFRATAGLQSLPRIHAIDQDLRHLDLETVDLLFFGGSGAYSVLDSHPWVHDSLDFFCRVAEAGVPAWASCFGFQGLSLALGGKVVHDATRQKLGSYEVERAEPGEDDPLFASLPRTFWAQLGHHDHVEVLPPGVTLLAHGVDGSHQAFRVDDSNFWGFQFHPELTQQTTYDRWLAYRTFYEGDQRDAIEAHLRAGPPSPHPPRLLLDLVALAYDRRHQR